MLPFKNGEDYEGLMMRGRVESKKMGMIYGVVFTTGNKEKEAMKLDGWT